MRSPRRRSRRRHPCHRDGEAHHRQHRRQPELLGEHPHAEGRDELQNDRRRHVVDAVHQPQHEPSERRTRDHTAGDREEECRGDRGDGEPVRRDGAHGQAVDQERASRRSRGSRPRGSSGCDAAGATAAGRRLRRRRRVARQRRQGPQPPPMASPVRARGRRRRPRAVVSPTANTTRLSDRHPVVPEIPERRVVGRVEQHGSDEERQRQLGRERERRWGGREREQRTAEREKDRIRRSDAPGSRREDDRDHEQTEQQFELTHGAMLRPRAIGHQPFFTIVPIVTVHARESLRRGLKRRWGQSIPSR